MSSYLKKKLNFKLMWNCNYLESIIVSRMIIKIYLAAGNK